jgi:ABC-type spermidine/putrescine transport system permease subunit I
VAASPTRNALAQLAGLPLCLLLVGFMVIPLAWIAWRSVSGAELDFGHFARAIAEPSNATILRRTLTIGVLVTVSTLAICYPVACLLTSLGSRALVVVSTFVLIPLFTAFLIRTYAWMAILGREGIVNNVLEWTGIVSEPVRILNTTTAVVIGMTHAFAPMAVFTLYASMSQIDRNLVPASGMLGANPVQAFLRIYLPLSVPALVATAVLVFILAIGFYITPALLGGPDDMMISQLIVVQMTTLLDFELGYASAVLLLAATALVLLVAGRFIPLTQIWTQGNAQPGHRKRSGGYGSLPRPVRRAALRAGAAVEYAVFIIVRPLLPRFRRVVWIYLIVFLGFLVGPLLVVVILSFSASPFVVFPPPGLSLQWWSRLAAATDWHESFAFSLRLGLTASVCATLIGTMGAAWLVRARLPSKQTLFLLALSPMISPLIVTAVALYIFEAWLGLLGTFPGLAIGHTLIATPYVVLVMSNAIRGLDRSLEDAAAIHGARFRHTLRWITLPILKPAIATAALLAFIASFDELLVGLFLLGRQTPTLPIKFWSDIRFQIDPLLSAASTLIVLMVVCAIVVMQALKMRQVRRRDAAGCDRIPPGG